MQKKIAGKVFGCKVNQTELDALLMLFVEKGFKIVGFQEKADVYIVHTCAVTHLSESKARHAIRQTKQNNEDALVIVSGCYAQIASEELKQLSEIDLLLGTNNRNQIIDYVLEKIDIADRTKQPTIMVETNNKNKHFEEINNNVLSEKNTRFFLKIQEGCENFCSYCIIPYARGSLKSRCLGDVIAEAEKAVACGYKEIVVTGINIGAYGFENMQQGIFLPKVLKELLSIKELQRLRISSIENTEVLLNIIEIMKTNEKLCRHLHIPLQSGDNDILSAMKRNYTVETFKETLENIRLNIPDISITTDIIVGFPNESEEQFQNTLNKVNEMMFSRVHIFPYSKRKGTLAANMSGHITAAEKKRRVFDLTKESKNCGESVRKQFLGDVREVLFESNKEGLTDNYFKVYLSNTKQALKGKIYKVQLKELYNDGFMGSICY